MYLFEANIIQRRMAGTVVLSLLLVNCTVGLIPIPTLATATIHDDYEYWLAHVLQGYNLSKTQFEQMDENNVDVINTHVQCYIGVSNGTYTMNDAVRILHAKHNSPAYWWGMSLGGPLPCHIMPYDDYFQVYFEVEDNNHLNTIKRVHAFLDKKGLFSLIPEQNEFFPSDNHFEDGYLWKQSDVNGYYTDPSQQGWGPTTDDLNAGNWIEMNVFKVDEGTDISTIDPSTITPGAYKFYDEWWGGGYFTKRAFHALCQTGFLKDNVQFRLKTLYSFMIWNLLTFQWDIHYHYLTWGYNKYQNLITPIHVVDDDTGIPVHVSLDYSGTIVQNQGSGIEITYEDTSGVQYLVQTKQLGQNWNTYTGPVEVSGPITSRTITIPYATAFAGGVGSFHFRYKVFDIDRDRQPDSVPDSQAFLSSESGLSPDRASTDWSPEHEIFVVPEQAFEFWITFEKYKKGDDGELVFVDSNVDSFDYGSHVIRFAFHVRNPWAYDYVITTINDFKVKVPEDITYLDILSDVTIPSGGWHVGAGEEKIFYPYWCDISSGDYHDVAFRIVGDQATLPSSEWAILGGDEIMIRLVRIWDWFETPWSSWMGLGVKVLRKMWDVSIHNLDEMYEDFSRSTPVEFRIKLTLDVYNGGNKLLTYGHVAKCSSIINVPEDKLDYLQTVVYISTAYAISVISCFMVGVATLGSGIGIPAGLALLIYSAVSPSVYEYIANKYAQLAADPWDPSYLDIIPDVVIEYPDFPECPEDFSPAVYDLIKERHMLGVELDAYSDAYFLAYNRLDTIRWYGGPPDIELDHLEKLTFLNNEMQRIFQRLSFINGLLNSLISEYAGEMSIGEMFLKVQVQLEMYQDRIVEDYGDDVYSMMIDLFTMDLGDMGDLRTPLALVFNLHILLARSIETTTVNLLSDFQADPSTNVPSILNINAPEEAIVTLPFSISAIIQADAGVSSVMIFYEDQSSSMIDYGDDHFAATVTYTTPGYHSYTIIVRDNNVNSLARKETVYLGFIYVDDGLPPRVEEIHVPVSVLLDSEGEMYVFIVKDTSFASCTAWLDGGVVINTMSQGVLSIPIPNELGMHEILVEASDTRGGTTILGPVTFEVVDDDVDPPAVFMSVPGWINPIEDCFTITFSAGDHSGIASYSLAILDGANTRVIAEHHGPWDALIDIDVQVCKELYDFTRASWLLLVLEVWDDDRDRPGDQLATTISAVVPVGAVAKIEDGKALVSASDDEAWAKPGWNRKQAMMHKLDATIDLMLAGNYREAYDKLLHDIKPKLTGLKTDEHEAPWGNGVFPAPWVIDVELQEAFRIWVNDALATISSMLCATPCITNDGNGNEDGDGGNGEDGGATNEPSSDGKPMTGAHDARAIVATCMVATLACAGLAGAACIARLVRTAPRDKQRRADRKAYQRVRR